jgi:hypothetical protein
MTVKALLFPERTQFGNAAVKFRNHFYKPDTLCSGYPLISKPARIDTDMFEDDIDQFESVYGFVIT